MQKCDLICRIETHMPRFNDYDNGLELVGWDLQFRMREVHIAWTLADAIQNTIFLNGIWEMLSKINKSNT